jgi:ABC-2 type transport system permease protein
MRALIILLEKEFRQIFRNPAILRIMFAVPTVQLLIMPLAADYEVKNVNICVVDYDRSTSSQRLIHKITATDYFSLVDYTDSYNKARTQLESDRADLILQIPRGFEKDLLRENTTNVFLAINAINGVKANIGGAYLRTVIADFNQDVRMEQLPPSRVSPAPMLSVTYANWYNPMMNYRYFMVPGVLVILVTMVGAFLSALNIVKEKEVGTLEQINVTPIRKHQFILGKLIPFWILGLVILSIGLTIARVIYGIVPAGSLLTIYAFAAVFLIAVLGLGLLVSTFASSQQQAMLLSFFIMMVFILMGGLFTSIDSMPEWAKVVARLNPVSYFIEVMRMVVLKGSGLSDVRNHLMIVFGLGVFLNLLAVMNYRKRS